MYGNPPFDCDGAQIRACSRQLATVVTVTGDLDDANIDKVSQYTKRFVLREKPVVLDLERGEFRYSAHRFAAVRHRRRLQLRWGRLVADREPTGHPRGTHFRRPG